jgi:hypothetical protein
MAEVLADRELTRGYNVVTVAWTDTTMSPTSELLIVM